MNPDQLASLGVEAFQTTLDALSGFRRRTGQEEMVAAVARAFAHGELGEPDHEEPVQREILAVQAGTGTGKSLAYLLPGIAIAKARKAKLIVSTSTVALQEQLLTQDLPLLASASAEPFTFGLAKGRGRYICKQKLFRRARLEGAAQDVLELEDGAEGEGDGPTADAPAMEEARVVIYRRLADALSNGWAGDRDSLAEPVAPPVWASVAAERHTCSVRACPQFSSCSYYLARRELANVDVIVANHNLVLASVGTQALPALSDALLVFDEAHHLPETAVEQFAAEMDLTRLRWLEKLPKAVEAVASDLAMPLAIAAARLTRELKASLTDTGHLLWENFSSGMRDGDGVRRLRDEEIAAVIGEPLRVIAHHAESLEESVRGLVKELRDRMKEEPAHNARWSALFALIGSFAPRLGSIRRAATMLLSEGDESRTIAKWCEADHRAGTVAIALHACPVLPGQLLQENLWGHVRAAVLTSATMTSCGSWEFFLTEAGLDADPAVRTAIVESPFRYEQQAKLVVRQTRAQPRNLRAYNEEVAALMVEEIRRIQRGAVAIFTSRRHMEQTLAAIPDDLRSSILVQGTLPRRELIAEHKRRVESGERSVIMGMHALGEGTDLPGALCEKVLIGKLPFATPSDPVSEVRAEYVESIGGSPFDELVVPAAGVRMLQWTGRAIRTETDAAEIVCFDRRLTERDYGRRILAGLPKYPVSVVNPARAAKAELGV